MLAVTVRRLKKLLPEAELIIPAEAPERLEKLGLPATALPISGRNAWLDLPLYGYRAQKAINHLPPALARVWQKWEWKKRFGRDEEVAQAFARQNFGERISGMRNYFRGLRESDAAVGIGGGYVNDLFGGAWKHVLGALWASKRAGKPCALFGQGLGPLKDPVTRAVAGEGLRAVDLLSLREDLESPRYAAELGVEAERVRVTGDDAIEMALGDARARENKIGVNIRPTSYAGMNRDGMEKIQNALRAALAKWNAIPVGAPIAQAPLAAGGGGQDCDGIKEALGGEPEGGLGRDLHRPEDFVRHIGGCRAMVTGSYHAGVLALAQGIAVVGLVKSAYYDSKFRGLASMFGGGCFPVSLEAANFHEDFQAAVARAWEMPEGERERLREAARRQVEKSRSVYEEFVAHHLSGEARN